MMIFMKTLLSGRGRLALNGCLGETYAKVNKYTLGFVFSVPLF